MAPGLQQRLLSAAARAEEWGRKCSREKDGEFESRLAVHGMLIAPENPCVRRFLDLTGEKLVHEYLGKVGHAQPAELTQLLVDYSLSHAR